VSAVVEGDTLASMCSLSLRRSATLTTSILTNVSDFEAAAVSILQIYKFAPIGCIALAAPSSSSLWKSNGERSHWSINNQPYINVSVYVRNQMKLFLVRKVARAKSQLICCQAEPNWRRSLFTKQLTKFVTNDAKGMDFPHSLA